MPKRKRNKQASAAGASAPEQRTAPAAEPEDEERPVWDESSRELAREGFRRQGYVPTHTLCSAVGYLIGVKRRNFMADDDIVQLWQSVYDALDRDKDCRSVRNLCQIRAAIMRRFPEACSAVQNAEYQDFLKKYVEQSGVLNKLYQDGCSLPSPKQDLNEYLLVINQQIDETFERLRSLPQLQGITFSYLKKAILYPSGIKKDQIVSLPYRDAPKDYPFGCYLSLEMPGYNILRGDDDFVEFLFAQNRDTQNRDTMPDLRAYRRSYGAPGLEKLTRFLRPDGNYQYLLYIDGAGIHTRELRFLLPLIRSLNENQLGKCILYCPHDQAELWSTWLQEERENLTLVEPKEEYASQSWAVRIAMDLGMRSMKAASNAAYVLITPSDEMVDLLKKSDSLYKKSFFVVLAQQPSDLLLRQLNSREDYCILEELIGKLPEEKPAERTQDQTIARAALQRIFPLDLKQNLQEIIKKQLAPLPAAYSPEEQKEYEQLLRKRLQLDIREDGRMRLILDPSVLK